MWYHIVLETSEFEPATPSRFARIIHGVGGAVVAMWHKHPDAVHEGELRHRAYKLVRSEAPPDYVPQDIEQIDRS